jgi:hypothetical protein
MNAKWLKQNAVMVGFVAGFLVLLGAVIWLQQMAAGKSAEVDASLAEQLSQLSHFGSMKPAPTRENIASVKKDREQVDNLYSNLLATIGQSRIEAPPDLRPVGFLQLMASSFNRLRQAADAVTPVPVKVQDNFAFGFGRYAGPPATLPARNLPPEDTRHILNLLVKQLTAVEQISTMLITNHVDEITQIHRAEIEPGANEAVDLTISDDPKAMYRVLPFEFQFTGTSDALRGFLNSLTQSKSFFVVRRLQITGETPVSEKLSAPGGVHGAAAAPLTPTALKRAHLAVTARIDLIEFPNKEPANKESAKKEPGRPATR